MNKVFLSGRLTRDVEVKTTQKGMAWGRTGIAVDRRSKSNEIDFFNLVVWDKPAEIMGKYCFKGSRIAVEGRLQFSQYEDKNGTKKSSVDVIVENFEFMDGRGKTAGKKSATTDPDFDGEPVAPEDVPF